MTAWPDDTALTPADLEAARHEGREDRGASDLLSAALDKVGSLDAKKAGIKLAGEPREVEFMVDEPLGPGNHLGQAEVHWGRVLPSGAQEAELWLGGRRIGAGLAMLFGGTMPSWLRSAPRLPEDAA